jgi:hypothetical protein
MDIDRAAQAMRDEEMLAEIEDFLEGCGSMGNGCRSGRAALGWIGL